MIIEASDLTYRYPGGAEPALLETSLAIRKGEFVILSGPSGCGKTTLCRCLNGLIPHFYSGEIRGEVVVAGLKVSEHSIYELASHVGLVFQNPENQLFALSVEKDVAFGLENLGMPREDMRRRVDWALKMTGISDLRERPPHELSGGQQQRVAIASVLAMKPDVMVLDEPTSFLDPLGAQEIFEVINDLNKKLGITVVLVEHRLDLASRYANHVIIMDKGAVVLDGSPLEIFTSERARLIGVGIPKATQLSQALQERGVHLDKVPVNSQEASQLLREVLTLDRG
ncbi:ATP-binding cassette domain-containing protein [Candidatus Bathyarchaeota archaeon]|nr:ATP-binding cassette domain-containing protein [Candidatus Bathyarchaeota archaeon]NIU81133.1 ATP-binding cassette domain-containing protein [Candidatus Bathyarchaeota archaeon]NIV67766.1 ATP-binding cassette domain-containing protein [Candidatus Bathyarchaeota archaeon]NIW16399.1 ATP-binding cassette domain-containing protein [Candidatus Bathyarchaeota archaeon]NIW34372.1 ATP-binding cassette domain-containing protein [Candidatus Bathyarchaeota archaeon]